MPRVALAIIVVACTAGCVAQPGPAVVVCPELSPLPDERAAAAADELERCADGCPALRYLVADYLDLRAVVRACANQEPGDGP